MTTTMAGRPVTHEQIVATLEHLNACRAARAAGYPVYLTTDPAWLLDVAIDRRAGWPEATHSRDIAMPVGGKLPKKADGDAQRHLGQLAHLINSRVRIDRSELGEWGRYLDAKLPDRFARPGED